MVGKIDKNEVRIHKHSRIRNKISGTPEKPRLSIYRSLKHIYAQIIDDTTGSTLVSSSTVVKSVAAKTDGKDKKSEAFLVGETLAKAALKKGITEVVFDRSGYIYTGRVQQIAEGARSAGLKF